MSFHEADSDLSRLNRVASLEAVGVDPRTYAVLKQSVALAEESAGAFDPTIAGALVADGFLPAPAESPMPDPAANWRDIDLIEPDRVRFRCPLWIDLGGVAKGYAVDLAMAAIAPDDTIQCVVNAGGDLTVRGPRAEKVLLRTQSTGHGAVPVIEIENGSLASSSGRDSIRIVSGHRAGPHRNGGTRRTVGSRSFVSVAAPSCMLADGLTKIVLALRDRSTSLLRRHSATAYLQSGTGEWRILGLQT